MRLTNRFNRIIGPAPIFWGYLGLVTAAELVTSLVDLQAGMIFHLVLVLAFVLHGALGRNIGERRLALALTVAPFIRLLSLSLPLSSLSQVLWYPAVAVPLLLGAIYIVRQIGMSRRELGLTTGRLRLQLMLGGFGLGLGVIEYVILHPAPMLERYDPTGVVLAALSLALFTGFNEEFIFRGLLQSTSRPVLGRMNLLYVSLLFGVLHIGYLSVLDVAFVSGVGLLFAYLVRWGGSILGVTLAHSLTNIMLFIVMPYLSTNPTSEIAAVAPWAIGSGTLLSVVAGAKLWRSSREAKRAAKLLQTVPLDDLPEADEPRTGATVSVTWLSGRTASQGRIRGPKWGGVAR